MEQTNIDTNCTNEDESFIYKWLWIHKDGCDKTRKNTHSILTHKQTREFSEDLSETMSKIWIYILKHKEIFTELLTKYPELNTKQYYKNKKNLYLKKFFMCIENEAILHINYEPIVTHTWEILFNEGLIRATTKNTNSNFNHLDYLDIYNSFWLSFSVYFNVLYNIFSDIKLWKAQKPISINVEISDIINPDFVNTVKKLEKHFDIKIWKWDLILEVLENQKIPEDSKLFKAKIRELEKLWINIALDDTISKLIPYESVIDNIKILSSKNIKIVKIDWKTIHSLYNIYQAMWSLVGSMFENLKKALNEIENQWIYIVAEWIENIDMLNFAKEYLWITAYQWFYFKNPNAINNLKKEYTKQD